VKNEKGKDTGELNVEIEWNAKEEDTFKQTRAGAKTPIPEAAGAEVIITPEEESEEESEEEEEEEEEAEKEEEEAEVEAETEPEVEVEAETEPEIRGARGDEDKSKPTKLVTVDVLKVRVINAKLYEKQDVIDVGDPYVKVKFNDKKFKTKVVKNTQMATYNEGTYIYYVYTYCLFIYL
jgi:hypothetical protein